MLKMRFACPCLGLILLAACGGSSTAQDTAFQLEELNNLGITLFDEIDALRGNDGSAFLSVSELQSRGSASYEGVMFGAVRTNLNTVYTGETMIGRTTLETDFTDGDLTGQVQDLVLVEDSDSFLRVAQTLDTETFIEIADTATLLPVSGTLVLSGGDTVFRGGRQQVQIDVIGDLTIPAGAATEGLNGDFPVNGNLFSGVTDDETLIALGDLQVENTQAAFSLDTILIAK